MVSEQHIEESLSISYVNAVVAECGQVFNIRSRDYGVDGSVMRIQKFNNSYIDMGAAFDCQLKATKDWSIDREGNFLNYDMKVDAFNKLVIRNENSTLPCFLVLLCLPQERKEWLEFSPDSLILRKCCYYFFLSGEESSNSSQQRIKIPLTNVFNSDNVSKMVDNPMGGLL